ncbi:MAG TPA: type II toxin-antitoxin system VapC family toxin [Hymenobacter sp.]|uniref:type II toxin-antitoxin system VapC family toxin n=1 Tax=Hymenobacter sp. TaxID=1898978 RepID=UPI002D7E4F3B|nr:type II toxin-antitoxin system VapC family toxin [Hymenobacter sp.]HET9505522.1 type II toxin-antitoxin system VapC family toxin [Hymenobacter sp.]
MGVRYLADTNAIIDLVLGRLPVAGASWLDQCIGQGSISLSVVTRIELLTKTQPATEYALMQELVRSVEVLPLDEPVIQQTIRLRQQRRIKLPDAIIAATALAHGLPLITRNVADFQGIVKLIVINPHDLAQLPVA